LYAGETQEALPYAERWIAETSDPQLLLIAAKVLFLNAAQSPRSPDNDRRHRRAIELAERTLADATIRSGELRELAVNAYLHIAMSYAELGEHDKAMAAWRKAREHAPDNLNVLLIAGLLNESQSELSQIAQREIARQLVGAPVEKRATASFAPAPFNTNLISTEIFSAN
jgi:tetratricopeptide (TPR) repeat protein